MSASDRARWTEEELAKLKPEELATLKQKSFFGTGFIVVVPDDRLGKDMAFPYLVTNRHVALPGVEEGKPCRVASYSFSLNHLGPSSQSLPYLQSLPASPDHLWAFPDDDAVDLAATMFAVSPTDFDLKVIPLSQFVTPEMTQNGQVVEGQAVIFTGLFIQYSGTTKLEPVVRSGTIAMLPSDLVPTTLRKPGHIYLAEAHAFGGNSGSPMFVDVNRFNGVLGIDYRFFGVVTGEVFESAEMTLKVTTSFSGTVSANSNVSVIVPAFEVKKLLLSKPLQQARDAMVAQQKAKPPVK
jgi:hypothetical protein